MKKNYLKYKNKFDLNYVIKQFFTKIKTFYITKLKCEIKTILKSKSIFSRFIRCSNLIQSKNMLISN